MKGVLALLSVLACAHAWVAPLRRQPSILRRQPSVSQMGTVQGADVLRQRGLALSEKLSGVSVFLVGMMGSGKSTVGNLFCKSLGSYTFLDMDTVRVSHR